MKRLNKIIKAEPDPIGLVFLEEEEGPGKRNLLFKLMAFRNGSLSQRRQEVLIFQYEK